ncbi:DUF397 domain-containing protein [Streptomyces kanamyceticus]|uniref:DUF397 domain-containing protein n=1 Tax=Streptomyces kanamyceticus TaxID=1967 RepID=A0A5J6GCF7_STRKN|nr:DUF397 domain-containing protein [Streptomyces kanamyceticus]QEU93530.1 DUF397 domain-containing protein [Streptomyces kanamyceticus]
MNTLAPSSLRQIQWQKSSFSGAGDEDCVEVAHAGSQLLLRESDDPDTVIATTPARLNALVRWQKSHRPKGS